MRYTIFPEHPVGSTSITILFCNVYRKCGTKTEQRNIYGELKDPQFTGSVTMRLVYAQGSFGGGGGGGGREEGIHSPT